MNKDDIGPLVLFFVFCFGLWLSAMVLVSGLKSAVDRSANRIEFMLKMKTIN